MSLSPVRHFILRVLALILLWVVIGLNPFNILKWTNDGLLTFLQSTTLIILHSAGFQTFESGNNFGILGASGVILGPPCNGLTLMFVYAAFFLAMPGKAKTKMTWIAAGVLLIQVLNLLRILILIYMNRYYPGMLKFNHDYTFTLVMYSLCFLSWFIYVRKNPALA